MPEAAAHKLQQTVDEITGYSRRTRKLVWGLIGLSVVAMGLAVAVAFLALAQSSALHQSQLTACVIGNQARHQQVVLWSEIIALSPGANPQTVRQFEAFIAKTFAPVNCAAVYK